MGSKKAMVAPTAILFSLFLLFSATLADRYYSPPPHSPPPKAPPGYPYPRPPPPRVVPRPPRSPPPPPVVKKPPPSHPPPPPPSPPPPPPPPPPPSPPPPAAASCPISADRLNVCRRAAMALNETITQVPPQTDQCCRVISGVSNDVAAGCLCSAIRGTPLATGLNPDIVTSFILGYCNIIPPDNFQCPAN